MPSKKKKVAKQEVKEEPTFPQTEGELAPQIEETVLEKDKPNLVSISEAKQMNKKNLIIFFVILLLVLLLAIAPAIYFYTQYRSMQKKLANPTAETQTQIMSLVREVSNLIVLPSSETPTIATVSDKSKLVGQPFFAKAENGDRVLIYPKAGKAYLYRPSMKKVIEVGPVNIDQQTTPVDTKVAGASTSATPTPSIKPVTVALYNGTTISGLTRQAEPNVRGVGKEITVVTKENASKDTYTETQVVVLTPSATTVANKIASSINGTIVNSLPEGESRPSADILVILGSSYQ